MIFITCIISVSDKSFIFPYSEANFKSYKVAVIQWPGPRLAGILFVRAPELSKPVTLSRSRPLYRIQTPKAEVKFCSLSEAESQVAHFLSLFTSPKNPRDHPISFHLRTLYTWFPLPLSVS